MLLGKVLAACAMCENKYVTWLPAYGAEVRGGTAHCSVIISDEKIGSPYIDKADILIIMNTPSFFRFKDKIKNNGMLFVNSSLVNKHILAKHKLFPGSFTVIASASGNIKVANMVALGMLVGKTSILKTKTVKKVILQMGSGLSKELIDINFKAYDAGLDLAGRG